MIIDMLKAFGLVSILLVVVSFILCWAMDVPFLFFKSNKKVYSRRQWLEKSAGNTDKDIHLSFDAFQRFILLNPEGWSWAREGGIYRCCPSFVYDYHRKVYTICFNSYKDYVKAARFWEEQSKAKKSREQELKEAKNMADFISEMRRRAKDVETEAERQMRETRKQAEEILERVIMDSAPSANKAPEKELADLCTWYDNERKSKAVQSGVQLTTTSPYTTYTNGSIITEVFTKVKNL